MEQVMRNALVAGARRAIRAAAARAKYGFDLREELDDLAQEGALRVLAKADQWDVDQCPFGAFAYGRAFWYLARGAVKQRRRERLTPTVRLEKADGTSIDVADRRQLTPQQREDRLELLKDRYAAIQAKRSIGRPVSDTDRHIQATMAEHYIVADARVVQATIGRALEHRRANKRALRQRTGRTRHGERENALAKARRALETDEEREVRREANRRRMRALRAQRREAAMV